MQEAGNINMRQTVRSHCTGVALGPERRGSQCRMVSGRAEGDGDDDRIIPDTVSSLL